MPDKKIQTRAPTACGPRLRRDYDHAMTKEVIMITTDHFETTAHWRTIRLIQDHVTPPAWGSILVQRGRRLFFALNLRRLGEDYPAVTMWLARDAVPAAGWH